MITPGVCKVTERRQSSQLNMTDHGSQTALSLNYRFTDHRFLGRFDTREEFSFQFSLIMSHGLHRVALLPHVTLSLLFMSRLMPSTVFDSRMSHEQEEMCETRDVRSHRCKCR